MHKRYLVQLLVVSLAGFGFAACGGNGGGDSTEGPQCQTDGDCADGESCLSNRCLNVCESDDDCASGESCKFDGVCVGSCQSDSDCSGDEVCNKQTNTCWPGDQKFDSCSSGNDQDCGSGSYCAEDSCLPVACRDDSDCAGRNICARGRCRSGCRPGEGMCAKGETCNSQSNICESEGCTVGSCSQYQTCNTDLDTPECEYTGDCGEASDNDALCQAYAEQEGESIPWICNESAGECEPKPPCESDKDCSDSEICVEEPNSRNTCRRGCRCTDSSKCDRACPAGQVCNTQLKCEDGCTSDDECTGDNEVCVDQQCWRTCQSRDACEFLLEKSCQDNSDCEGLNVCDQNKGKCRKKGLVCRSSADHSVCQECNKDNQCAATKYCEVELGRLEDDDTGLCKPNPPSCPKDGWGDNHAQQAAHEIQNTPFEPMGMERPYMCRDSSSNDAYMYNQGEWWKVQANTGQVIDVTVEYPTEAGNIDLALLNSTGQRRSSSIRPPGEDGGKERIVYGVPAQGTYFIHVTQALAGETKKTRYDLKVDVRAPKMCTDDGKEENDTRQEAKPLSADMQHDLEVCGNDDDFFVLDAKQNQKVDIVVSDAPARLGDIDIQLLDSSGTVLKTVVDSTGGQLQMSYLTQEAEELILKVYVPSGAGRVDYKVQWTQNPNQCFDQFEPNDTCPGEATQLSRTTTENNYKDLSVCTDDDYYAIDLQSGDTIHLSSTYDTTSGELQMTLFGPNSCTTLAESQSETDLSGSDKQLTIDHTTQNGGTYYINLAKTQGPSHIPHNLKVDVDAGSN